MNVSSTPPAARRHPEPGWYVAVVPHEEDRSPLAEPAVEPSEYDASYYLEACNGAREWRESEGAEAAGLYYGSLHHAGFKQGDRLLDIGTGRGELVCVACELGASQAVGVDYSEAAVELAQKTVRAGGSPPGASIILADARRIPVDFDAFDLVTLLDVVEHLTQAELSHTLSEALRALCPGGRLFVHTAPNATVYETTYRLQRRLVPGRSSRWPENPRNNFELRMHVNEQSMGSLRRALTAAGFIDVKIWLGEWIYTDFVPNEGSKRLYRLMARIPGLKRFGIFELFATGSKPPVGRSGEPRKISA